MKILYLLGAIKHPAMRGELRHYHMLRVLSRRHTITVLALARTEVAPEALDELRGWVEGVRLVNAAAPPSLVAGTRAARGRVGQLLGLAAKRMRYRRAVSELRQVFNELVSSGGFDVVMVHGNAIRPVLTGFNALPVVVDICDAGSLRLRHALRHVNPVELPWRLLRYWQIRRTEAGFVGLTPHVSFICSRDRDAVLGKGSGATIIPNGVDLHYWSRGSAERRPRTLLFTGVMSYPPNADAAFYLLDRILPRVRQFIPDVELLIAGRDPSLTLVRESRKQSGVTVTGYLDDLRPSYERATVFVAPIRFASGTQNKILEAMAMELPVVTTPVAADGLRVNGMDAPVLVDERPEDIADHLVALFADAPACGRLGMVGREFVKRQFSWEHSADLLEGLWLEAAAHRSAEASTENAPGVPARRQLSGVEGTRTGLLTRRFISASEAVKEGKMPCKETR